MAKIVTANTLATGHVVFRTAEGGWAESLGEAEVFAEDNAAERALEAAMHDQAQGLIVDPFVTDKGPDAGGRPSMTLRDTIRAFGPTIRFLPENAERG